MSLTKPGAPGGWTDFLTPEPNRQKWTVQPLGDRRTTPGGEEEAENQQDAMLLLLPRPPPPPPSLRDSLEQAVQNSKGQTNPWLPVVKTGWYFFLCIIQNYLSRINLNCVEILEKISLILNRVSILILFLQGIWVYYYIYPNREAEGVDSKAIPQWKRIKKNAFDDRWCPCLLHRCSENENTYIYLTPPDGLQVSNRDA